RFSRDWSSDVCSSDLGEGEEEPAGPPEPFSYDDSSLVPEVMRDLPYEELEVTTSDRVALYARLYDPSQALEEPDPSMQYPLVVRSEERRVGKGRSSWS